MEARKFIPEAVKAPARRLRGKSVGEVAHYTLRQASKQRSRRKAAGRVRSPWMLATRLAEHPAVKYSVLSDPTALEHILNSEKGRELIRLAAPAATEPTVEQFLSLLANQPDRIAEFLERDDVRAAVEASGVGSRNDLPWLRDMLRLGDPRAADLLLDVAGEGVTTLLDDQNFRHRLIAGLTDESSGPVRLVGVLAELERMAPRLLERLGYHGSIDHHDTDRHDTDRHDTDRHDTDRHDTDRHGDAAHAASSGADSQVVASHVVASNGVAANGAHSNGTHSNGTHSNGTHSNGTHSNGTRGNGAKAIGVALNGKPDSPVNAPA